LVSITRRGPVSGSGSGGGFGVVLAVAAPRRGVFRAGVFGFGSGSAVSVLAVDSSAFFSAVVSAGVSVCFGAGVVLTGGVRLVVGVRLRALLTGGVRGVSTFGFGSSTFGSGVGSGVGVAATSVTGGSGSLIRAPTEVTRFVFRAPVEVVFELASGVSAYAMSGPPASGSNDPPKYNW